MFEGRIPEEWKEAAVSPIFKKGSRHQVENYRPISLTSVFCKVMEKVIRKALLQHMIENGSLSDYQHGFIKGRSCTTQLLKVIDKVTEIMDQRGTLDMVFLDFAKAFDSVPHKRLLVKLEGYGINGNLLAWIQNFLTGRRQKVGVNGIFSRWLPVISGVPQGSVLGPILFICYINDMPELISSFIYMYADDTKVFRCIKDNIDNLILQSDLDQLSKWTKEWQLKFNVNKCKVMYLGAKNEKHQYYMDNMTTGNMHTLEETTEEKDLGVWINNTLKPSNHITRAVNKANQLLGLVRRSFTYMDGELMKQLFTSIIRPHLEYGNVVWHPNLKKDIEKLESVQHRATKMIPGMAKLSYEERLRRLDLPSLVYRRIRGDLIEVYKYMNGIYKTDSKNMLPLNDLTEISTRGHSKKLKKQNCRNELRSNFFSFRVVNMWNSLPEEVVSAPSVNCFKGRFDKYCNNLKFTT